MKLPTFAAFVLFLCGIALPGQTSAPPAPSSKATPAEQHTEYKSAPTASANPGEKKFRQNCSRCHNAPEELSPRISGTVLMHMRVRASLSSADESDILRYLAP